MKITTLHEIHLVLLLFSASAPIVAQGPISQKGCFSSSSGLTNIGSYQYQSPGYCQEQCVKQGKAVGATTKGSDCLCGDKLPAANSKTSDSSCNTKCQGYGTDTCGGNTAFSVFLTGLNANPGSVSGSGTSSNNQNANSDQNSDDQDDDSSSSAPAQPQRTTVAPSPSPSPKSNTKQAPPSVVTKQSTIVVTAAGGATQAQTSIVVTTEAPESKSSKPNVAGIAAGVVVGVVAICAMAGGILFFLRRRKRQALEDEYRQNAGMGSYNNLKPSPSSAGSTSDSRLEPSVMMQRRQSDVSIADNQDYSRRILKVSDQWTLQEVPRLTCAQVTNPDHS